MKTAALNHSLVDYHIISRNKSNVWVRLFSARSQPIGNQILQRRQEKLQFQIDVIDLHPFCQYPLYLLSDLNSFSGLALILSSRSSRYCLAFFTKVYSLATMEMHGPTVVTEVHKRLIASYWCQTVFMCYQALVPHILFQWLIQYLSLHLHAGNYCPLIRLSTD